ncbi:hypothetical protein D0B54_21480 [Solimonas sp. K1W22B-7]|uniref:hypothetical protein n=1 Tax=Solimonas sp. K1W22B-7 TaxID=2303331 RepID=UPI000E336BA9|nr:hypothetical protein [Solimonas sp. K1W22B-7]AXQ31091.1 hypothetical protein D0B54_21480 [Solimonas sp. K1W22B-7]
MDTLILDDMPPQEPEHPRKGGIFTDKTREALANALEHHSSYEIGRLKMILALIWTYRWGYSTPTILDLVVGGNGHGNIASRLLKAGYIERFGIYLGSRFDALPRWITVLTPDGVREAEANVDHLVHHLHRHSGERIQRSNLVHDLRVQRFTLRNLSGAPFGNSCGHDEGYLFVPRKGVGKVVGFMSPAELGEVSLGSKLPDAVWLMPDGKRLAIEVELTAKWGWEFDITLERTVNLIRNDTYQGVLIVTRSKSIQKRYESAFAGGQPVRRWVKNLERKYVRREDEDSVIESRVADAISVVLRSDL